MLAFWTMFFPAFGQYYGHYILSTTNKSIGKDGMQSICSQLESAGIFQCQDYWSSGVAGKRGVSITDSQDLLFRINNISNFTVLFKETMDDFLVLSAGRYLGPSVNNATTIPTRNLLQINPQLPSYFTYLGQGTQGYEFGKRQQPTTVYLIGGDMNIDDPEFKTSDINITTRASRAFPPPLIRSPCTEELGTHIASLIAGLKFGIAKDTNIINVSLLNFCSEDIRVSKVVNALDWIIENSAKHGKVIVVLPVQITGASRSVVNDMVQDLLDKGAIVIAGAGNSASDSCLLSPAAIPGVITVAAASMINSSYAVPWESSNYGSCVTIWAPGNDILAVSTIRPNTVSTFSGTSQAMAIVAGIVAGIDKDFTYKGIMAQLLKYSKSNIIHHLPPRTTNLFVQLIPRALNNSCRTSDLACAQT